MWGGGNCYHLEYRNKGNPEGERGKPAGLYIIASKALLAAFTSVGHRNYVGFWWCPATYGSIDRVVLLWCPIQPPSQSPPGLRLAMSNLHPTIDLRYEGEICAQLPLRAPDPDILLQTSDFWSKIGSKSHFEKLENGPILVSDPSALPCRARLVSSMDIPYYEPFPFFLGSF